MIFKISTTKLKTFPLKTGGKIHANRIEFKFKHSKHKYKFNRILLLMKARTLYSLHFNCGQPRGQPKFRGYDPSASLPPPAQTPLSLNKLLCGVFSCFNF